MRCFDFHKIFQDFLLIVPNTSALGFASVPSDWYAESTDLKKLKNRNSDETQRGVNQKPRARTR